MNRKNTLYRGLLLALAASALTGTVVLADDPPQNSIVAAEATSVNRPLSLDWRVAHVEAQDAAVQAALQGVLTDSRIELERRLAGRKSEILTAGM